MDTSVRVAVRIRPQKSLEAIVRSSNCVFVTPNIPQIKIGNEEKFTFDLVFGKTSTQEQIYQTAVHQLVEDSLKGYNATVLAYGQTGSGKTYTIGTGFKMNMLKPYEGIIPRAIRHLFSSIDTQRQPSDEDGGGDYQFTVAVQFIEVYNDAVIDLLNPDSQSKLRQIHEDKSGDIYVTGITTKQVSGPEEALRCLEEGAQVRSTASTKMNAQSSRSHALFTILIRRQRLISTKESDISIEDSNLPENDVETLTSKFHFVDLAGAEQLKTSGAIDERAREGIAINTGLFALGNVISALGDKSRKATHIPYRDSKLTRLLQDSLGGNSQTLMIACISPNDHDYKLSLNTLRYANRAKNIKNHVQVNQDQNSRQTIFLLRNEIEKLQSELSKYRKGKRYDDAGRYSSITNEITALIADNQRLQLQVQALVEVINTLKIQWSEATSKSLDLINNYLREIEKHQVRPHRHESADADSEDKDTKPEKNGSWWRCR